MPLMIQKHYFRSDARTNPGAFYIFGDNEERVGYGGQAGEMRDEPNAIGIATLSFKREWSDNMVDVWRQVAIIKRDFAPVWAILAQRKVVVWPADGIGTGIAALDRVSPRTFGYIQAQLINLKRRYGVV